MTAESEARNGSLAFSRRQSRIMSDGGFCHPAVTFRKWELLYVAPCLPFLFPKRGPRLECRCQRTKYANDIPYLSEYFGLLVKREYLCATFFFCLGSQRPGTYQLIDKVSRLGTHDDWRSMLLEPIFPVRINCTLLPLEVNPAPTA